MNRSFVRTTLLTTAAVAALGTSAWAQQQQAQAQVAVEEIVVTARQRSESLQEIPLSIAAFSAEDIREQGFRDLGDIALQTTGMTFRTRGASGVGGRINSQIRIRGIATGGLPHLQPVSLFVDGVYSLGGANVIPLNDLERVEVIKGPQSAFFGRNTFAGAVNYITKNPSLDNFQTQLDVSAATYSTYDASVLTSAPLVDGKLAAQVNARLYSRGRQFTATDGGGLGQESSKTGSLVLYAKPTEDLTVKARIFYQKDDDGHPATAYFSAQVLAPTCAGQRIQRKDSNGNPATLTLGNYFCGQVPELGQQFAPKVSVNTSLRPSTFAQVRRVFNGETGMLSPVAVASPDFLIQQGILRKYIPGVPTLDRMGSERNNLRTSLNIDWNFLDGYNFHAVGGYNDQKLNYLLDFDGSDVESWYTIDPQTGEDYSAEARISSPGEDRFRWLVGGTYYDQTFVTSGAGGLAISGCIANLPGFPTQAQCNTPQGVGPSNNALPITGGNLAEVFGVYGSVSFDFTEELTLDIEGRYLEDKRTAQILAGTFRQAFSTTYKQTTPRFILNYKPTDETTLYAQAARGTLPGVTNGLVAICSNDPLDRPDPVTGIVGYIDNRLGSPTNGQRITLSECAQLASQFPGGVALGSTPSQKLDAIEIGWKQTAFDNSLRFNLTGYYYKWKNLASALQVRYTRDADDPNLRDRVPKTIPNTLGVSISGSQKLYGIEFESGYNITDSWDAQFNISWNENKWIKFSNTSAPYYPSSNRDGLTQQNYPKWLANLTSTYNGELNADWGWYLRGDVSYTGKRWVDLANLAYLNDYYVVNSALGVKKDDMRLEFFVRNLFDEDAWISGSGGVDFGDLGSLAFSRQGIGLVPQDKRSFGVRMNYNF